MIRQFTLIAILALLSAIVLGNFGSVHPAFDTLANFRVHLSVILMVLAVFWLIKFGFITGLLFSSAAVMALWFSVAMQGEYLIPAKAELPSARHYTLLNLNLLYDNKTPQKVIDLVGQTKPDIITFNEISYLWKRQLEILDSQYPHTFYCPEWADIGGSMIYSRYPMTDSPGYCHEYGALGMKDVVIGDNIITIGAVHLRWPWPASGPRQVDELKPVLNRLGKSAIIVGDFNTTTWTWQLKRFANYGNLQILGSIGNTWMFQLLPISWAKYAGFPIDNAMVKGNIVIEEAQTLEAVGSDHLPVLIRFAIKQ